jgi:hypothetical protein
MRRVPDVRTLANGGPHMKHLPHNQPEIILTSHGKEVELVLSIDW